MKLPKNLPPHLSTDELNTRYGQMNKSPLDNGTVAMITCRPDLQTREILTEATLDPVKGLIGDNWYTRGSRHTEDGRAHPEMQLTLMNRNIIDLVASDEEYWYLAGDQFYVDFDLSHENLPAGTQLKIGEAIIEITAKPHTGCKKFTARFGVDALKFIMNPDNTHLRLRGVNARVIQGGVVHVGDTLHKVETT